MGRKGTKKKENEGFRIETAKDPIDEDSPEVIEAVEKFNEEQSEAIADLMDESDDHGLPSSDRNKVDEEKPDPESTEEPAEIQEQKSQPEAEDSTEGSQAKVEEQQTPEVKADVPESETKEPTEQKESEFISGEHFADYTVEVVTEDGAKSVPLSNLVATYGKYPSIQRKYQDLKPVMDLAQKAQVKITEVLPLLELGIQTYAKQIGITQGTQPIVDGTMQMPFDGGTPGQYQGPFKDAEQDEYYKEADPDLHASMHRNFQMAQSAVSRMANLETQITQMKTTPAKTGPSDDEVMRVFDDKIRKWSGDHTDYFTAPNIGEERLKSFENFIINNHAKTGLTMKDLTPNFLQAEFARFDPRYNLSYMEKLAAQKVSSAQKNDSGMFAEGSDVRSKAVPLDEQQKHMDDML